MVTAAMLDELTWRTHINDEIRSMNLIDEVKRCVSQVMRSGTNCKSEKVQVQSHDRLYSVCVRNCTTYEFMCIWDCELLYRDEMLYVLEHGLLPVK